jgi:hypothetical protein
MGFNSHYSLRSWRTQEGFEDFVKQQWAAMMVEGNGGFYIEGKIKTTQA